MAVAAYIESHPGSAPTVKQHLAAIRMLFDWLVTGQVVPFNPAASVRGPKHVVKKGKTPVLSAEDARTLLDSIPLKRGPQPKPGEEDTRPPDLIGLRDRALIGVMVYSFARIGAVIGMKVEDYYQNGKRWWLRLHEKGGKFHEVPAHHNAEAYLDAYLAGRRHRRRPQGPPLPLRRRARPARSPASRCDRRNALDMVKRRAKAGGPVRADLLPHLPGHRHHRLSRKNGGTIEHAQQIAAHDSPKTTKLYDRTSDQITLDEVERIVI